MVSRFCFNFSKVKWELCFIPPTFYAEINKIIHLDDIINCHVIGWKRFFQTSLEKKHCPLINVRDIIIFFHSLLKWQIINGAISLSHLPIIITIFIFHQHYIPFVVVKFFLSLALSKCKTIFHNLKLISYNYCNTFAHQSKHVVFINCEKVTWLELISLETHYFIHNFLCYDYN